MKKLLFVKHANSSFIKADQVILEKSYWVIPFLINQKKSPFHFFFRMLALIVFVVRNAFGTIAMVTWFGDYHSAVLTFFGKLLRIKVIIFAGGQESICYPELRKGVFFKKLRGICVKYALRNATLIIPNHASLIYHENHYYRDDGKKDGIRFYVHGIKTPMVIIPNGIDVDKFQMESCGTKQGNAILTVGTMNSSYDFVNKGFDLFIEMARKNPDLDFTIIGVKRQFTDWLEEQFQISKMPNLRIIFSYCPDEILINEYNRAKVFVQASITEGMPNTLSEAMLCKCIPVGSNVNGIPDAIGETGVIVYRRDVNELVAAVRKALTMNTGELARQHVLENFTLQHREAKILALFSEILR
jgi:glycosyltransferase involved in cell wall biosynthesis